ncbi:hypothetical protein CR513_37184, partial [Mucuna pruriens]
MKLSAVKRKEFTDVFLDEVPHGLPSLRGIEHQIDLISGCPIPNRPTYRTNPKETKEIQKQVNGLLQKGFVRENLSPCSVPIILVPKKDGTWHISKGINVDEEKVKFQPREDENFQVLERINDNVYKLDLSTAYGNRMNPFEKGGNDRDPTNKANDNLHDTRSPMTRSKNKMMKQSLSGLCLRIKENIEPSESEAAPKWVTLLQVDEE